MTWKVKTGNTHVLGRAAYGSGAAVQGQPVRHLAGDQAPAIGSDPARGGEGGTVRLPGSTSRQRGGGDLDYSRVNGDAELRRYAHRRSFGIGNLDGESGCSQPQWVCRVMTPVLVFRFSPFGNVPLVMLQV